MSVHPKRAGALLLIVDDWEALERYEDRLSAHFSEVEACPMAKEGLERARERHWDRILIDLVLEDVTPAEAVARLKKDPRSSRVPLVVVGAAEELADLHLDFPDRRVHRPFEWAALVEQLIS